MRMFGLDRDQMLIPWIHCVVLCCVELCTGIGTIGELMINDNELIVLLCSALSIHVAFCPSS